MRKPFLILMVALAVLIAGGTALRVSWAADASTVSFLEGSQKKVSIDLRDSDIVDVIKFLAQKGKFNVFINPGISGRVSLYLQEVRIADILDIILLSNGLAHKEKDSIVYIMTQDEYKTRYGQDYGDAREVSLVKLRYASPAQVFKMLDPTKSAVGSIVVDEQTGTIIIMETDDKMKFMMKVIEELDQPLETRVFDLSYSKAADVVTLLQAKLGSQSTDSIQADARSNQIIVTSLPHRIREIEAVLKKVDRKTREVLIDTQIIKIDLSDDKLKGVDWQYFFKEGMLEPLDVRSTLTNSTIGSLLGQVTYSQSVGSATTNLVYKFLQTYGDSRVLASPRITVIEEEEAKILIGSREAYVTSTTTTGSSTSTVSESVNFIDVGISLNVSANINKEGFVTMKIKPEVSSVRETLETDGGTRVPIVDTTQAETRVMVKDGTTIVIGGLRKNQKSDTVNEVPGFSKLPVLGHLFHNRTKQLDQSELVVFLTPHIIEGDTPALMEYERSVKEDLRSYESIQSEKEAPLPPATELAFPKIKGDATQPMAIPATVGAQVPEAKGVETYAKKSV